MPFCYYAINEGQFLDDFFLYKQITETSWSLTTSDPATLDDATWLEFQFT
jgi:hypothetical protein